MLGLHCAHACVLSS